MKRAVTLALLAVAAIAWGEGKQRPATSDRRPAIQPETIPGALYSQDCPCFNKTSITTVMYECPMSSLLAIQAGVSKTMSAYCANGGKGGSVAMIGLWQQTDAGAQCLTTVQDPLTGDPVQIYRDVDAAKRQACQNELQFFIDQPLEIISHHWGFDGTSTTYAGFPDYYGYDDINTLTDLSKSGTPLPVVSGRVGRAVKLNDGTGSYFYSTSNTYWRLFDLTVSVWIKALGPAPSSVNLIISANDGATADWKLQTSAAGVEAIVTDSVSGTSTATVTRGTSGIWAHYVMSYDADTLSVSLQRDKETPVVGTPLANGLRRASTQLQIGVGVDDASVYDELSMWASSHLSTAQIANLNTPMFWPLRWPVP